MRLLSIKRLPALLVLLAGTLLICHGVFGGLHLVCVPPECVGGPERGAEHQPQVGVAGGAQHEHPAGHGTSTEYFAVVVAGLLGLLLSLLPKVGLSLTGSHWFPILRQASALFRLARAPTLPVLQVFRL